MIELRLVPQLRPNLMKPPDVAMPYKTTQKIHETYSRNEAVTRGLDRSTVGAKCVALWTVFEISILESCQPAAMWNIVFSALASVALAQIGDGFNDVELFMAPASIAHALGGERCRTVSEGNSNPSKERASEQDRDRFSNRRRGWQRSNEHSRVGSRPPRRTLLDTGRE